MSGAPGPVILTCAVTGSIHTPSMTPHLPITADEIVDSAASAAAAGAAVLHLHARDAGDGRPVQTVAAFAPLIERLGQRCNAVLNITTGGAPTMLVAERAAPAAHFRPELASLNMGSMNFGLYPMLKRHPTFQHAWEPAYLEGSRDRVFRNTFADIEYVLRLLKDAGTRFEFECYDIGHVYTLLHFAERALVEPPFFVQGVFGLLGGIGAHADHVAHMHATALRLLGPGFAFSALGAGRHQMAVAEASLALGGHVRVGLEDSIWIAPGRLATSNAEQVLAARSLVERAGRRLATPDEARALLRLRGAAVAKGVA